MTIMKLVIVFTTLGMLTMPVVANIVMVDDFVLGDNWTLYGTGERTDEGDYAPKIIGGRRDTTFNVFAGAPLLRHCRQHVNDVHFGRIEYESGSGGQATWSLEYGKVDDLDHDMTFEGRVLFSIEVLSKNLPDLVHLTITVTSERGIPREEATSTL